MSSVRIANLNDFFKTRKMAGKTVFITGASRGIGEAIGLKCARDGANVSFFTKWYCHLKFISQNTVLHSCKAVL